MDKFGGIAAILIVCVLVLVIGAMGGHEGNGNETGRKPCGSQIYR